MKNANYSCIITNACMHLLYINSKTFSRFSDGYLVSEFFPDFPDFTIFQYSNLYSSCNSYFCFHICSGFSGFFWFFPDFSGLFQIFPLFNVFNLFHLFPLFYLYINSKTSSRFSDKFFIWFPEFFRILQLSNILICNPLAIYIYDPIFSRFF